MNTDVQTYTETRAAKKLRKKRFHFTIRMMYIVIAFLLGFSTAKVYYEKKYMIIAPAEGQGMDAAPNPEPQIPPVPSDGGQVTKKEKQQNQQEQLKSLKNALIYDFSQKYSKYNMDYSFYIKDLRTNNLVSFNNKKMNSASLIKLYIMETAYRKNKLGTQKLAEGREEVIRKMITKSDNESSNILIDDYQIPEINKTIVELGFVHTELQRKMYDKLPPEGSTGKNNYTSVEDTAKLLEQIYNGNAISKETSKKMLDYLKAQERINKIPDKIKDIPGVTVANKTGELNQVENDAAIISGKNFDFIFVIIINNIPYDENNKKANTDLKKELQNHIADMALQLVDFFN